MTHINLLLLYVFSTLHIASLATSYQLPEMDEQDSSRASSTTPIVGPHSLNIINYDVILFAELTR
jgi:hypothetical protein